MEINSNTDFNNILFENVDIISPLSDICYSDSQNYSLPSPPNVTSFSENARLINSYIRKCSDNTYDIFSISAAIRKNYNNFRENLLYSMYKNKYYYDIFSKCPTYSEWISKVDQLKQC